MIIAHDRNGFRIPPYPKGQGFCQLCTEPLVPHCGEIKVWHWQHRHDRNCDPWKEHETEWHRQWKERFPIEWREVVIRGQRDEKHIADIKTARNKVIEFQNSSISTSTVRIREQFYADMVWVVNAKEFKHNFTMRSKVNRELREIDKECSGRILHLKRKLEIEIKGQSEKLEELERTSKSKVALIGDKMDDVEELKTSQLNSEAIANQIKDYWMGGKWPGPVVKALAANIEVPFRKEILDLKASIASQEKNVAILEGQFAFLSSRRDVEFQGKTLKTVGYPEVSLSNFHKVTIINRESLNSFFVEGGTIKSELEYRNLQFRLNSVILAIDPEPLRQAWTSQLQSLRAEIALVAAELDRKHSELVDAFTVCTAQTISMLEAEIETLNEESDKIIKQTSDLRIELYKLEAGKDTRVRSAEAEMDGEKSRDRFTAMNLYKGVYYYDWKHERQTWRFADMPVYFDMGDGLVFRRESEGIFIKSSYEEFVTEFSRTLRLKQ